MTFSCTSIRRETPEIFVSQLRRSRTSRVSAITDTNQLRRARTRDTDLGSSRPGHRSNRRALGYQYIAWISWILSTDRVHTYYVPIWTPMRWQRPLFARIGFYQTNTWGKHLVVTLYRPRHVPANTLWQYASADLHWHIGLGSKCILLLFCVMNLYQ